MPEYDYQLIESPRLGFSVVHPEFTYGVVHTGRWIVVTPFYFTYKMVYIIGSCVFKGEPRGNL